MGYVDFIFTPKSMKYTTHVGNLPMSPYFTCTSSTLTSMSCPLVTHRDAIAGRSDQACIQWILTGGKVSNFRWEFRTLIRIASLTASATGGYVM